MSVQHWCRACFTQSPDMIPIFDKSKNDDAANVIVEVLQALVGHPILPTDIASNFICVDCLNQIREIHPFLVRCQKSDTTFRQLGESQVLVRRLDDPIKFLEFVIEDKGLETTTISTNGHSKDDSTVLDLTAESGDEIQSDEEEEVASGEDMLECPACLDAFGMISVLRTHLVEVHTMNSQCIICNNAHFDDIWDHTREHTPRKYACNHCSRKFVRFGTLERHILTHHNSETNLTCGVIEPKDSPPDEDSAEEHEPLQCSVCSKIFNSRRHLYRHELMHLHSDSELVCEICGQTYCSKDILDTHMATHSNCVYNDVSQYYEDSTSVSDLRDSSLMQFSGSFNDPGMEQRTAFLNSEEHMQTPELDDIYGHMNSMNNISYGDDVADEDVIDDDDDDCLLEPLTTIEFDHDQLENYSTNESSHIADAFSTAQIRKDNKSKKYQYECDVCFKTFRDKGGLEDHKTIHTGERPFGCQICGKRFRVKRNLREHVISHSSKMPFPCDLCGARFKKRNAIKMHMQQRHKNSDSFPCGICDTVWGDVETLSRHWKVQHAMSYNDVNVHVKKQFHK